MKILLLFFAALTVSVQASAFSIEGYENLSRSSDDDAKVAITAYFQAFSELLAFLAVKNKNIYIDNERFICLAEDYEFTASGLRKIVDDEVKNPEIYVRVFGGEWKKKQMSAFVMFGLKKKFPCN